MTTKRGSRFAVLHWFSLLAALILAGACVPVDYESSPLGTVVVGGGEEIQIRALGTLTRAGDLGVPSQRGVVLAVADYGPIKGHGVSMGAGLDSLCSAEGGAAAAAWAAQRAALCVSHAVRRASSARWRGGSVEPPAT